MSTQNLAALERAKIDLRAQLGEETKRHEAAAKALRAELLATETSVQMASAGIDEALVARARLVIDIGGSYAKGGTDRASEREEAIAAIVAGGEKMRHDYFGTKNYDRWSGQGAHHSYGMGPRHGSMCFTIGLTSDVRKRPVGSMLTEEDMDAAVYYLRNLEKIEAAKTVALAA
jgi:hypothetical protein